MTHDDESFAHELRARVDRAAPTIDVDTAAVLPRARRRRARHVALTGVASVGAVALAAGWVAQAQPWEPTTAEVVPAAPAPSSSVSAEPTPAETTSSSSESTHAVLDEDAGVIRMPIDDWAWSAEDYAVERTAVAHYVVGCLQDAGYEAEFLGPLPPDPGRDAGYGVWRIADAEAERYASVFPASEAELAGAGSAWDREAVPRSASRDCHQEALEAGLTYDPLDFEVGSHPEAPEIGYSDAMSTDAAQQVRAEWRDCLTARGVPVPTSPEAGMVPDGVYAMALEEQIRIAAVDVECKQELDTVQQLADLDAALQAEYIEANRSFLTDRHAVEEEVLDSAWQYLDDQGVEMP
jgi:hypothetical protein